VRRRGLLIAAALAAALAGAAGATAPPDLSAEAYVVESAVDGTTLAARAADERRRIASITKLMTVLVTLERARLDDVVVVPAAATRIGESGVGLRAGERLTVRDLAIAALVASANDAATALALHVAGTEERFVALMNRRARALGMGATRFANPHGLDEPGQSSSARDTLTLLRSALRTPFVRTWAGRRTAVLSDGRRLETTNDLLGRVPALVAGKTGHTDDAGWSEVAVARAGGATVYASVLGAPSRAARNDDLERLVRWSLARYRPSRVVDPTRVYATAAAGWGLPDVGLVAARAVVRPASVDRPLVEQVVAPSVISLPVTAGAVLGEVRVFDGRRLVARAPLVADRSIAEPGLLGKGGFVLRRALHHLGGLVT
jgi:D-alanyl-D-alanine carboxypeptidase (penicillin-binding protein 5/6)